MAECSARKLSPITAAQAEAGRHCLQTLLNCYCREVAGPNGQVSFGSPFGQNDWPLGLRAAVVDGQVMHLHLPHTATRLIGAVEEPVPLGRLRLRSSLYGRTPGRAWAPLDWAGLAALLIRELSLSQDVPFNDDLLAQIRDSVETVHAILSSRPTPAPSSGLQQYIEAEQALVLGHPFHPAPKSRQGFNDQDRLLYSPELRTSFPLHWFAVRKDMLHQRTLLTHQPDEIIARHAPVAAAPGYSLVPAHPWQAGHILGLRSVRKMLADQTIRDLGPLGKAYLPTSSIRTMFHPEDPFFLKLSLHVRITNCTRKNAYYELDGALEVTRVIRDLMPEWRTLFPDLRVLEEPAFLTVDPPSGDLAERTMVSEAFGLILREGVQGLVAEGLDLLLTAVLFADYEAGVPRACDLCRNIARKEHMPYAAKTQEWFAAYLERLIPPVLHAFFAYGIVFEPHLQNTLVGLRAGRPAGIVLRDFEGVKLVEGRFDRAKLAHVSPRAQEALHYTEERGWNRIAYCLFINQLGEAVEHLAQGDAALARCLWRLVRETIERYQRQYGTECSRNRLDDLLAGTPLPAKNNLLVRFAKQADRYAGYAPLANPLSLEDVSWS